MPRAKEIFPLTIRSARPGLEKLAFIPSENQALSISLHTGIGIFCRFCPQFSPLSEPQISRMIGFWQTPKSDTFRAQRTSLNFDGGSKMYPARIISLSFALQPKLA